LEIASATKEKEVVESQVTKEIEEVNIISSDAQDLTKKVTHLGVQTSVINAQKSRKEEEV